MIKLCNIAVAPVWGRGLKSAGFFEPVLPLSRSRVGAWIEIMHSSERSGRQPRRSRVGAWIEIVINESVFMGHIPSLPCGGVD